MIGLDECRCEVQCLECDDCFVAKCECECEVETGLKDLPDESGKDNNNDDQDSDKETEKDIRAKEKAQRSRELGIKVGVEDRLPEY
jgi:hypothetical protein